MQSLHIIYASTSGHTEHVVNVLADSLKSKNIPVTLQKAEEAGPEDLLKEDVLLLASGTWNTGGVEGQLNPHMHTLLLARAKDVKLAGKSVSLIGLGDDRYHFTARATEYLLRFVSTHGGKLLGSPLVVINEPYGQEEKVIAWGEKLIAAMV